MLLLLGPIDSCHDNPPLLMGFVWPWILFMWLSSSKSLTGVRSVTRPTPRLEASVEAGCKASAFSTRSFSDEDEARGQQCSHNRVYTCSYSHLVVTCVRELKGDLETGDLLAMEMVGDLLVWSCRTSVGVLLFYGLKSSDSVALYAYNRLTWSYTYTHALNYLLRFLSVWWLMRRGM